MKFKMIEIRDAGTRIAALAIKTEGETPEEQAFWRKGGGYGNQSVILVQLDEAEAHSDAFKWRTYRTMREAHLYVKRHFDELPDSGAVVDVEYIKGETAEPKDSEIWR